MHTPSPEEMGNVVAKFVLDIGIYTQYNSFYPIMSILQCMYLNSKAKTNKKQCQNTHVYCHVVQKNTPVGE